MRLIVRGWLAMWAGWTALALFLAVSTSLTYRSTGRPANWALTTSRGLAEWWLWALLTPLIAWLARRYPIDERRRWRHVAIHLAAGTTLAVVKTVADRAIFAWISGFWTYLLYTTLALQLVIYSCIVTATQGLEYYRRSREREQLESRLAEARLQLLSMQLQPHFLFNTLNTIAELVHHDPDVADDMIVGLSDLLRLTLDLENTQQITLEEELALLAKYLEIQRARFGDRLQVHVKIDDEVQAARVPVLLLQPLVENSIRHGLSSRSSAGRIEIHARRHDDRLLIEVTDDGERTAGDAPAGRKGVGLANTRARIEALYGSGCTLQLTHTPEGTRVLINMPLRLDTGTS